MNPEYYPIISGAIGGAAAAGAFKGPIETLTQIWYLTLGRFTDNAFQKYKVQQAINTEKFRKSLETNIDKIPEENIQEPKISVVGPALEASKFYMEEDEIRSMFAKLIASSMDKTQSDSIHPSFVEMIKMLSPLDAKNLYYLYHYKDETISGVRITTFVEETLTESFTDVYKHVYLGNPECQDNTLIEPSIDNLIRLKLVDVTYTSYKSNDSLYDKHRNNPLFLTFKRDKDLEYEQIRLILEKINNDELILDPNTNRPLSNEEKQRIKPLLEDKVNNKSVDILKGKITLTALGQNFCKVCL
ncbi:DUF4393 domain-containing protein [Gallibacterium anatis]|uniref:DUF4393 domain-containing protein n=1 Tax=Gallibacterium anatis TaxID=750 RepID=UPI00254AE885|nr:DUF4393 domain-containing protein [Gallibacterium anatis]WIM82208.1 DUF4393 domain-containing protein [Gallibacterium anatis]WIM82281.1 DUF4393 domain-containing protein [Gallibacterium anatis]